MKLRRLAFTLILLGAGRLPSPADVPGLTALRLNVLDEHGYFTPAFKAAVHGVVNSRQALARATDDEKKFRIDLPDLQKQSSEAAAQTEELRKELALYTHPEDSDFGALQAAMKNSTATPEQRLPLAQAFIWSYPSDPRQAEAEQDLQQIQRQLAAEHQTLADAAAARIAAHAALIRRAEAGDLSLKEWQDFLRDMSQQELLGYLGHPQEREADYWIYAGGWTTDPSTKMPVGLRINFNGTRVLSVVPDSP